MSYLSKGVKRNYGAPDTEKCERCLWDFGKVKRFFYREVSDCCYTPFWMGRAYCNYQTHRITMVIYPFHWAFTFACWINYKWNRHRLKPSWIDNKFREMDEDEHE